MDFAQLQMHNSRTEQKKARERLQQLAPKLASLNKKHWEDMPVSAYFLDELRQLANITSPAAKNRQIKRMGKLMAEENRHRLIDFLFAKSFDSVQMGKILAWQTRLNLVDDNTLKQFVRQFNKAEYHTLFQLLLWIEYAKAQDNEELLGESLADYVSYIKEVALLSN